MAVFQIIRFMFRQLYKLAVAMKKAGIVFIPTSQRQRVKKYLLNKAVPNKRVDTNNQLSRLTQDTFGINLIGYARAEMGIGESCRIAANCLSTTTVPYGIINYDGTNSARMNDLSWKHMEMKEPKYYFNIFHINAEQMVDIYAQYSDSLFRNHYNIGYWHWELPDFPDEWIGSFSFVDEIWVPSTFIANAISIKSPVPVMTIPHGVEVKSIGKQDRISFGLPNEAFLFLTMYDVKSYQERKNPQAVIESFKLAFHPDDLSVGLVIKVNTTKKNISELNDLQKSIESYSNIYLIQETVSREETNALLAITDSYISLHRSEGFGLGLAEAMYLGKPVIGTNWSSNTDFMKHNNSCLVDYHLVRLNKDIGPYKAFQYWAEPDIKHAAQYMKRLVLDKEYRKSIAQNGQETIRSEFSPQVTGQRIQKRLEQLTIHLGGLK